LGWSQEQVTWLATCVMHHVQNKKGRQG
jgi:hypothetical protein